MTTTEKSHTSGGGWMHMVLPLLAATLLSFGGTVLLMSFAYIEDLALLSRAPEAVWLFICGVPTDSEMVFPLLVGVGSLAVISSIVLASISRLRKRATRQSQP